MEASERSPKFWSNGQTYTMAIICLMLGVIAGYLVHAPAAGANVPQVAMNAPAAPGSPAPAMPSAADLKRMADKQVAPLLADLQKHPNDADLLAKIGRAYLAAQQMQSAQQYYEQSVAAKATPDTLNELAFIYVKLGDLDKAIATLDRARKIDPKNPKVLYNLGYFEWKGKADPKAALAIWEALLKADPNNPKRAEVEQMMAQAKKHLGIAPGTKTDKPAN
jgi:tetratricopeptide (TPR) repeat protein